MAKTLTIYPISDVSIRHSKEPSNSQNGYTLIYDVEADDDETGLYQELSTSSSSKTSTVKCGDNNITNKIYLRSISYLVRAKYYRSSNNATVTSNITPNISINNGTTSNGTQSSLSENYTDKTGTFSNVSGLNTIYNSIYDANIVLGITTNGSFRSSSTWKDPTCRIAITQANLTITYDDVFDCSASAIAGTGIASVSVNKNEVIDGETATFTATLSNGFEFDGWYSDAACTNKVSSSLSYQHTVIQDTTLYAKGVAIYSVSVVADSYSTVSSSASQATHGTNITVTTTVTDPNRKFDGWYSNPQRTTLVSSSNPYIFELVSNTTLYANTIPNETIYVKINGTWSPCSKAFKKVNGQWVEQNVFNNLFDTTKNYKIIIVN